MGIDPDYLEEDLYDGNIWIDFACVPQQHERNRHLAISSLASYISNSSYFMVLAGPWQHENGKVHDVRAWCRRGWCRFEQLANALSLDPAPIIYYHSSQTVHA